ncbi:hypothetical protein [Aporhodopirellula aestuarii]|uniref:Uncharacterized protein n=1 Tax=Aporhodopirellula aestuarii TaxID=2950107 RepID=A0ABT0U415_9BACT|nr:hypothetical protein [Aporhodopirellula aestuarii]MCM2371424.1 hypothetical protein [Aporhodopirellula aestuarii]
MKMFSVVDNELPEANRAPIFASRMLILAGDALKTSWGDGLGMAECEIR